MQHLPRTYIFEVHAIQSSDEHSDRGAKSKDAELQVQQHQRVTIRVQNCSNDLFSVLDRGDQIGADLIDFVGDIVVRLEQELNFFVIVLLSFSAFSLFGEIHGSQIVVSFQYLIDRISDKSCLLLERAELLRVDQQMTKLVSIDVLFKLAQDPDQGLSDALKLAFRPLVTDMSTASSARNSYGRGVSACCELCFCLSLPSRSYMNRLCAYESVLP